MTHPCGPLLRWTLLGPAILGACSAPPPASVIESSIPLQDRLAGASSTTPLAVAHRGRSATHPENTLPAFEAAMELGVELIEFDVRQSADDVLICIHDETVDRTTAAPTEGTRVAALTAAELTALDAGTWQGEGQVGISVPTLAAALRAMRGRTVPMIEHKAGDPARYVELLQREGLVEQVILQSFDWDFLREVHALEPRILLGALGPSEEHGRPDSIAIQTAKGCGAWMIHWQAGELTREEVDRIHRAGCWSCCYTVDQPEELHRVAGIGVDAICSNEPSTLLQMRSDGELHHRSADH